MIVVLKDDWCMSVYQNIKEQVTIKYIDQIRLLRKFLQKLEKFNNQ